MLLRQANRPTQQDQARIEIRRGIARIRRRRRSHNRCAAEHQRQRCHTDPGPGLEQTAPRQRHLQGMAHFLTHGALLLGKPGKSAQAAGA